MEHSKLRLRTSHLPLTTSDHNINNSNQNGNGHNNGHHSSLSTTPRSGAGRHANAGYSKGHNDINDDIHDNGVYETTGADHKHRKRIKRRKRFVAVQVVAGIVALYFCYRWAEQFMDFVLDTFRSMRKRRQRNHSLFDLHYNIPVEDIPPENWPVPIRFFRPHNAKIIAEARNAIVEFGIELRSLLGNTDDQNIHQLGRKYLMPWSVSDQQDNNNNNSQDEKEDTQTEALVFRKRLRSRAIWLRGDSTQPHWPLSELPAPVDDQALVISAGDKQLHYLKTLIYTVRVIHQSTIPIRIVYRDDQDLTENSKQEIQQSLAKHGGAVVGDIQYIDLSQYFDLQVAQLKGWNLKAFGMLAVPETRIAVMDADVLLLRRPEELFLAEGFQRTGALFYHDRVKPQFYWNVHVYARWLQPNLSAMAEKLFWYGGYYTGYYTSHVQEAGMLLLDKRRRSLGVWAACLLFGRVDIRKYIQMDHMYGDKEVYWTAFEALGEPYEFARYYPGVVGGTVTDFRDTTTTLPMHATQSLDVETIRAEAANSGDGLCGRLLHFDDEGNPLWSNGGYMLKEDDWSSSASASVEGMNPAWFVDGGDSQTEDFPNPWFPFFRNNLKLYNTMKNQNQVWTLQRAMGVECLPPNAREIRKVPEEMAANARKAVQFYLDNRPQNKKVP